MKSNELYHYGVLGMKWGVRRNRYGVSGNAHRIYGKAWNAQGRMARKLGNNALGSIYETQGRKHLKRAEDIANQRAESFKVRNKRKLNELAKKDYTERGRSKVAKYMEALSKDYTIIYNTSTGQYDLRDKKG